MHLENRIIFNKTEIKKQNKLTQLKVLSQIKKLVAKRVKAMNKIKLNQMKEGHICKFNTNDNLEEDQKIDSEIQRLKLLIRHMLDKYEGKYDEGEDSS